MKPNFSEMKIFIFNKALFIKKKIIYNKEKMIKEYENLKEMTSGILQSSFILNASFIIILNFDSVIIDLTKQLMNLILMIQVNMNNQQTFSQTKSLTTQAIDRLFHCI